MAITPALMTGIGAVAQGSAAKNADDYNAKIMGNEGAVSGMEANEATNTQLRKGNMAIGRMTAAAVQSGGGVGGSTADVLNQSAHNAELDALNVRYSGILRQQSFADQASLDKTQGQDALASGLIGGAGGILKQYYGAQMGTGGNG